MPNHDRTWRRRVGCDALQPTRTAHPVGGQPADLLAEVGHHGRNSMVVVRLDPHDARLLRRAKADREHRAECDRHLSKDVTGTALADNTFDPINELDRFDAALEHCKERSLGALVGRVLARHEGDVGGNPRKSLAAIRVESREDRDRTDLVCRHHERHRRRRRAVDTTWQPIAGTPETANGFSRSALAKSEQRYRVPSVRHGWRSRGGARRRLFAGSV